MDLYKEKAAGSQMSRVLSSRAVSTTYSNVAENMRNPLPKCCEEYDQFTINEIMNGNPDRNFIGLLPLVRSYIALSKLSQTEFEKLDSYISIISGRCSGDLRTPASWIRDFVSRHPEYRHDSVVTESIAYDLCQAIKDLQGTDYSRY
jgi:glutamate--cysteine ligase catalytic subunit